ncbi:MAG: alkane 1-monooxygenase [Burkholderiales bacterium]|nr:alkane 1-monooxygenase [Burkholderiales bacterium]
MDLDKNFRFSYANLFIAAVIATFFFGGHWLWAGTFGIIFYAVLGEVFGDDDLVIEEGKSAYAYAMLITTLPLLAILFVLLWWYSSKGADLFQLQNMLSYFGVNLINARAGTTLFDLIGGSISVGMVGGIAGITVSHELGHRKRDKLAQFVSNALAGLTLTATFMIEHTCVHHAYVCTAKDGATAKRGESLYRFILRSVFAEVCSAWKIEAAALQKRGYFWFTWRNKILQNSLITVCVLLFSYAAGGIESLLLISLAMLTSRFLLDATNYVQHYGLVRVEGTRVEPRHSWNSHKAVDTRILYGLSRHSDHHTNGSRMFWQLKPQLSSPILPHGYMVAIIMAIVPPVWFKVSKQLLRRWDNEFATSDERLIAAAADAQADHV